MHLYVYLQTAFDMRIFSLLSGFRFILDRPFLSVLERSTTAAAVGMVVVVVEVAVVVVVY